MSNDHRSERANATIETESDFALYDLGNAFALLQSRLEELRGSNSLIDGQRSQAYLERETDEISDQMVQMAWQVTDSSSHTMRDLHAKACALNGFVGHETTDLADQLAASLCRDIIAVIGAQLLAMSH